MGYIKIKKHSTVTAGTSAEFDLVSAENVGDVKLVANDIVVNYLSGYKVTIDGSSNLVQADVDAVLGEIDKMNGASGVAPLLSLSSGISSTTIAAIS